MDIKNFPQYVEIQTASLCNASCKICPYQKTSKILNNGRNIYLDIDVIKKLIDEIAEHNAEVKRVIPYMNNEPFLDNRIIEILRYIKSKMLFVELSTNASNLNRAYADIIVREKLVDNLRISFFSAFENTYKELMPGLSYSKVLGNIYYFLNVNKNAGSPIDVEIIQVMHENMKLESEKEKMQELFNDTKLHYFGYLDRAGNASVKNSLLINECDKVDLAGCSLKRLEERFVIGANGDVIICSQDWMHEEVIGNVNNSCIHVIWNGIKRKQLLQKLYGEIKCDKNFICKRCKLANLRINNNVQLNFKGDNFIEANDKKKYI